MSRYAILSDIHANLFALEAVLQKISHLANKVDGIYCLGDLVVYGIQPVETLKRLKGEGLLEHCLCGNNDYTIGHKLKSETTLTQMMNVAGLFSKATIDSTYRDRRLAVRAIFDWTKKALESYPEGFQLLVELKESRFFPFPDVQLVHASPCEPLGLNGNYLRHISHAEEAFLIQEKPVCFFGHTHLPTLFEGIIPERGLPQVELRTIDPLSWGEEIELDWNDGRRYLINPGSVGQPRDRDNRAAFLVFDTSGTVEFHRVDYPFEKIRPAVENQRSEIKNIFMAYFEAGQQGRDADKIEFADQEKYTIKTVEDLADRFEKAHW